MPDPRAPTPLGDRSTSTTRAGLCGDGASRSRDERGAAATALDEDLGKARLGAAPSPVPPERFLRTLRPRGRQLSIPRRTTGPGLPGSPAAASPRPGTARPGSTPRVRRQPQRAARPGQPPPDRGRSCTNQGGGAPTRPVTPQERLVPRSRAAARPCPPATAGSRGAAPALPQQRRRLPPAAGQRLPRRPALRRASIPPHAQTQLHPAVHGGAVTTTASTLPRPSR